MTFGGVRFHSSKKGLIFKCHWEDEVVYEIIRGFVKKHQFKRVKWYFQWDVNNAIHLRKH